MAKTTASAIGTNRIFRRRPAGRTSARRRCRCLHVRETKGGDGDLTFAPSRMASLTSGLPSSRWLVDILDGDGRVVHQDADRQRRVPPRVIILIVSPERRKGRSGRYRMASGNRDSDNGERRAPAAEEQQDHQAGQDRRNHPLADHARHGCLDEHRLVAEQQHMK